MNQKLEQEAKKIVIERLEGCARLRAELRNRPFEPYPESFKNALMRESYRTLKDDLTSAQAKLKEERGY